MSAICAHCGEPASTCVARSVTATIDPACPGSPHCAAERARHARELAEVRAQLTAALEFAGTIDPAGELEAARLQRLEDAATIGALRGELARAREGALDQLVSGLRIVAETRTA